jgi:uncharacterized membrane protein YkoI
MLSTLSFHWRRLLYKYQQKGGIKMMNKKLGLIIGSMVGATVLGLGVYHSSADAKDTKLNTDNIQQMVSEQYPGTITELELDKEGTKKVYEVEVRDGDTETDLKLDADTGEVLKEKSEVVDADDDDIDDNEKENTVAKTDDLISEKKATDIAKKEFDGEVREVELDEDDGRVVYEIELVKDKKEADFDIDAVTGEILEMDIDTEDDDD